MKNNIVALLTCFTLVVQTTLYPTIAWADDSAETERVTTVNEGEPAPFNGTLFNTAAAARLLTDLNFTEEACQLKLDRELGLQKSRFQLDIDTLTASRDSLQFRFDETLAIKNSQLLFLQDQIKPQPWYQAGELWFAVGIISGVLITVGAGYALGQAAN